MALKDLTIGQRVKIDLTSIWRLQRHRNLSLADNEQGIAGLALLEDNFTSIEHVLVRNLVRQEEISFFGTNGIEQWVPAKQGGPVNVLLIFAFVGHNFYPR